jgi:HNH endonuclease
MDGYIELNNPYSGYMINPEGKIFSQKRNQIMKLTKKDKYNFVCLCANNKEKSFMVCKLVAEYHLPKVEGKNLVWHKNENFIDDRVENLQWVTEMEMKVLQDKYKAKNLADEYISKGFKIMNVPFETYAINSKGEVYNLVSNKKLNYDIKDGSYLVRLLGTDKKPKFSTVQKLVAEYFLNEEKKDMLRFRDGNNFNINVENLQWVTRKEYYDSKNKNKSCGDKLKDFVKINKPYENYLINKKGEIYSLHKEKVIDLYIHKEDGYYHIKLYEGNDKYKDISVHLLVAEAFIPKVEGKNKIWHKDGNKLNNNVDNLVWVTEKELKEYRVKNDKAELLNGKLKGYVEIDDYDGYYYINKEGKIYSFYKNMFLKHHTNDSGYLEIGIGGDIRLVHRLVAEAFIPKVKGKYLVNHEDGNKKNPLVDNLEWTDHVENALHAHATGLHPKKRKVNDYIYYQFDDDGELVNEFKSISEINEKLNVKYDNDLRKVMDENDEKTKVLGYYWKREKIDHDIHEDEEWKSLNIGSELDKYIEVSNYGRVRNIKTGHYYVIYKGCGGKSKYYRVTLKYKNKKTSYSVHRLVGLSFLENKFGKDAHMDHIDKNPSNNYVGNLQWLLPKDHMKKDKGIPVTQIDADGY